MLYSWSPLTRLQVLLLGFGLLLTGCATCKYGTKDPASISPDVKSFRVNYLENRANYVNPQITPQVTEKLKQKIIGQTRLRQTNNDDAHYDINGTLTEYSLSTTGITNQTASLNRLTVSFHLVFKNALDPKKNIETDISRSYEFEATKSLNEFESANFNLIVKNLVDEIFNKVFINW